MSLGVSVVLAAALVVAVLSVGPVARAATSTATFNYTGSIDAFTVPAGVTTITITALGAGGGSGCGGTGGSGVGEIGTFSVTPGEALNVLVGQAGASASCPNGGGGGGGSFVYRSGAPAPLIAAGGGGGGCCSGVAGRDASTASSGGDGGLSGGAGGSGGSGGGGAGGGNGGGGFSGSGGGGNGGESVTAGAAGGSGVSPGGFGGGGGGGRGGGGGGGYSGGGGGGYDSFSTLSGVGGGGGSFNAGTDQSTTTGAGAGGDGSVTIEYATPASSTSLGSSRNPSTVGQAVTFTATVTGASPTGAVEFRSGGTTIAGCGAQLLTGGSTTCVTSSLSAGRHAITAVYGGDSDNAGSSSPPLTQTVRAVAPPPPPPPPPPPSGPFAPGAPTGVSAVAADGQATVSCIAPADDGGEPIVSYTAIAVPGGAHASGPSCPLVVTGLLDGVSYTFAVTASSSAGTSAASAPSAAVTPRDTQPPAVSTGLSGRFSHGTLILTWTASSDNVAVDHYQLYLNGAALVRVAAGELSARVRTFLRAGRSVFTVRAVDAAGNQSDARASVTVKPVARPPAAPEWIPRWAWQLLAWQQHAGTGTRPATPKTLPHWYATWKAWRLAPFHIIG